MFEKPCFLRKVVYPLLNFFGKGRFERLFAPLVNGGWGAVLQILVLLTTLQTFSQPNTNTAFQNHSKFTRFLEPER